MREDPWIAGRPSTKAPRARLFCFPHAGGGSVTYRSWARALPDDVQVCPMQLPGREQRIRETPIRHISEMTDRLAGVLGCYTDRPYALFGHSMGAVLAYEAARRVFAQTGVQPWRLIVSGHRAPHLPSPRPVIHTLPDDAFIAEVRSLNGTAPEIFEHAELVELLLPMLRADFQLSETYAELPGPRLSCPLLAMGGNADADVSQADIAAWRETTTGPFRSTMLPGSHFFINTARDQVLEVVRRELSMF